MIISDGINKTEKYDETQEYFFSCRAMFRWLYEKGILKKISFLYKEEKDNICFALDTDDLILYKNQFPADDDAKLRYVKGLMAELTDA